MKKKHQKTSFSQYLPDFDITYSLMLFNTPAISMTVLMDEYNLTFAIPVTSTFAQGSTLWKNCFECHRAENEKYLQKIVYVILTNFFVFYNYIIFCCISYTKLLIKF